jgi:chromosome segregation ATPase
MMNNMTSQNLQRAAELAQQIEVLNPQLTAAQATVSELSQKVEALQTELDSLGLGVRKASKGLRHFSEDQKAKISAGLKAAWARRKAAVAPATPVAATPVAPSFPTE